jgi:hypothetical protein
MTIHEWSILFQIAMGILTLFLYSEHIKEKYEQRKKKNASIDALEANMHSFQFCTHQEVQAHFQIYMCELNRLRNDVNRWIQQSKRNNKEIKRCRADISDLTYRIHVIASIQNLFENEEFKRLILDYQKVKEELKNNAFTEAYSHIDFLRSDIEREEREDEMKNR